MLPRVVTFLENRMIVTRSQGSVGVGGGGRVQIGSHYLMITEFLFCKMKRVLGVEGGDNTYITM